MWIRMFRVEDYISITKAIAVVSNSSDVVLANELLVLRSRISDDIMKDYGESKLLMSYLELKVDDAERLVVSPDEDLEDQPLPDETV